MAEMELSLGLRYHLLILAPSLADELEAFGVHAAAAHPELDDHDIERAFFAARALTSRLPEQPEHCAPALWPEIMQA